MDSRSLVKIEREVIRRDDGSWLCLAPLTFGFGAGALSLRISSHLLPMVIEDASGLPSLP